MPVRPGLCALACVALCTLTSCGAGPPRVLESITVNGVSSASGASFTATGHFNTAPLTVNNLQVAWFQTGPIIDPVPNWDYTMTRTGFKGVCYGGPGKFYVVAYAPMNPDAAASGSMPFRVFQTLVEQRSVAQDDGFVAGSTTLSCTTALLRGRDDSTATGD